MMLPLGDFNCNILSLHSNFKTMRTNIRFFYLVFLFLGLSLNLFAGVNDSILNNIKPELIFKSKYEILTDNGDQRFSVRNSRIGLKGSITKAVDYKFMVDLSGNGKFSVLDLYFKFKFAQRWSVTLGQASVPIFNSYTISPANLDFANRPFIGKFFNSSRDIGLTAEYLIKKEGFPISAQLGVYSGQGINNANWTNEPALGARVIFGSLKEGIRFTAKGLKIKSSEESDCLIYGADLRYKKNNFKVETEVMQKYNEYNKMNLLSYYAQVFYCFPVSNSSWLSGVEPALRWDQIGEEVADNGFGLNRATIGVNFNLKTGNIKSVLRVNYEHLIDNADLITIPKQEDKENKFSVEVLFAF